MSPNTSSLYNKPAAADSPADNAVLVSATPAADAPSPAAAPSPASPVSVSVSVAAPASGAAVNAAAAAAARSARKSCLKRPMPPSPARPASPLAPASPAAPRPVQKNRRRCWTCRAKVGLTAVTCRCGLTFCGAHRYAEEHGCAFNFKAAGKRKLAEDNPRVVPAKVARIN